MKRAMVVLAVLLVAATTQAELVANGDFETGYVQGAVPYGWNWTGESVSSGTIVSWQGTSANQWVYVLGPSNNASNTLGGIIQTDIPVTGGEDYIFTFDAKCTSYTSWFSVQVRFRDAGGVSLGYENDWVGSYFTATWGTNAWFVPSYSASGFTAASEWWTYPDRLMTAPPIPVSEL